MTLPVTAIRCRAFRLPRQGYAPEECQDASVGDPERGRFAIADGAAESPYSALWARLLVEEFVRRSERQPQWANWLPSLQQRWADQVRRPVDPRLWPADSVDPGVPWYLEPGLLQGAFATFLGLVVGETSWDALAVGDSCLFQVRGGQLRRAFPIERAADFSNAPWLVGSRTSPGEVPHKEGAVGQGDCQSRDHFWLMTDALAQWFLIRVEEGGKPWLDLEPLLNLPVEDDAHRSFAEWIEDLRTARQLRNDDVALLAVML
jgi:hypothetical protein